jgi:hypothetical protein
MKSLLFWLAFVILSAITIYEWLLIQRQKELMGAYERLIQAQKDEMDSLDKEVAHYQRLDSMDQAFHANLDTFFDITLKKLAH